MSLRKTKKPLLFKNSFISIHICVKKLVSYVPVNLLDELWPFLTSRAHIFHLKFYNISLRTFATLADNGCDFVSIQSL